MSKFALLTCSLFLISATCGFAEEAVTSGCVTYAGVEICPEPPPKPGTPAIPIVSPRPGCGGTTFCPRPVPGGTLQVIGDLLPDWESGKTSPSINFKNLAGTTEDKRFVLEDFRKQLEIDRASYEKANGTPAYKDAIATYKFGISIYKQSVENLSMGDSEVQQLGLVAYLSESFFNDLQAAAGGLSKGIFYGVMPIALAVMTVAAFSKYALRSEKSQQSTVNMFAAFGCFLGIFIASSRDSVMGSILPLIITFVSGYVAYVFKPDGEILNQRIVPAALIALIFSATFGAFFGGELRRIAEDSKLQLMQSAEKESASLKHQRDKELTMLKDVMPPVIRYSECAKQFGDRCLQILAK